jgi:hypothetical protein
MSSTEATPTLQSPAEVMATELKKISEALQTLNSQPIPRELIILYVQRRTRLAKRDIEAVFNAVDELNKKTAVKHP